MTECNCSICRRSGLLWAYYPPADVLVAAPAGTDSYEWGNRFLSLHRCRTRGCITHWWAKDPAYERLGVNARLLDPELLAQVR